MKMLTPEKRRSPKPTRKRRSVQRDDSYERHDKRRRSENEPKHLHLSKLATDSVSLANEEKPAEVKVLSDDLTQLVATVTGQYEYIELETSDISDGELLLEEDESEDFVREIMEHIIGRVTPEDFVREIVEDIIDRVTLEDFVREIVERVIDRVTSDVSPVAESGTLSSLSLQAVVASGEIGGDVGNEGTDRELKGCDEPTGMSLEEDFLSNDSTMSYAGSDVMRSVVSFEEGCILSGSDRQTEGCTLSIEAEMGTGEHWSHLSSGDQHDESSSVQDGSESFVSEARAVSESVGNEDVDMNVIGSASDDVTGSVPPAADHGLLSETVVGDGHDAEKNLLSASEVIVIDCESVLPIVIEDDDDDDDEDNVEPAGENEPVSETVVQDGHDAEKSLLAAPEVIVIDDESVPQVVIKDDDDDDKENLILASEDSVAESSVSQSATEGVNLLLADNNIVADVAPVNEGEVVYDSAHSDDAEVNLLPASGHSVGEEVPVTVGEPTSGSIRCDEVELNLLPTSDNIVLNIHGELLSESAHGTDAEDNLLSATDNSVGEVLPVGEPMSESDYCDYAELSLLPTSDDVVPGVPVMPCVPPIDDSDALSQNVHADDAEESSLPASDDVSSGEAAHQSVVEAADDAAENSLSAYDETLADVLSFADSETVLEHLYGDDIGDNLLLSSGNVADCTPTESILGDAVNEDTVADMPSVTASDPLSGDGAEQNMLPASDDIADDDDDATDDDFEIDLL